MKKASRLLDLIIRTIVFIPWAVFTLTLWVINAAYNHFMDWRLRIDTKRKTKKKDR
jgi:hypothetical protein